MSKSEQIWLINRKQDHVFGKREMTVTQVKAASAVAAQDFARSEQATLGVA